MTSRAPVAVVTGAARGIGRRVAEVLSGEGYALVLVDLRGLDAVLGALEELGATVLGLTGDVAAEGDVEALGERVRERFGRVDVLVNNAGVSLLSPAEETTPQQWRRVIDVNLTGPCRLSRALGRMML